MIKIPMGRRVCLATEVTSELTAAQDGGWTFDGVAQLYQRVNDRLMYFFAGSGAKTIRDRVERKAIKLHDGHPRFGAMAASVTGTVGFVSRAEERQNRMLYTAFISSANPEVEVKIRDETINQNSMEIAIVAAVDKAVPLDSVPELQRDFVPIDKDGMAIVLGIREYFWAHLGLVSGSSQDFNSITEPPSLVGLAGLPATAGDWDPAEAKRSLSSWAGEWNSLPNVGKLSCGYLARFGDSSGNAILAGQIAAPDPTGSLVVNLSAIEPAMDDLAKLLKDSGLAQANRKATLDAAYERVKPYLMAASVLTGSSEGDISEDGEREEDLDGPKSTDLSAAIEAPDIPSADSQTAAGPGQPPTAGSEAADVESATDAHLGLHRHLDALRLLNPRVDNGCTTSDRRGLPAPSATGPRGNPA